MPLFVIIIILIIIIWFINDVICAERSITYQNSSNMSGKNSYCPFCWHKIPKITETKTIERRKRHRVRFKKITVIIGEDWATHVKTCTKLKEFLNDTKENKNER